MNKSQKVLNFQTIKHGEISCYFVPTLSFQTSYFSTSLQLLGVLQSKLPSNTISTSHCLAMAPSQTPMAPTGIIKPQPQSRVLSLPPELRLLIWEHAIPKLTYFSGDWHPNCPHSQSQIECRQDYWDRPQNKRATCACNNLQLSLLLVCKQTHAEVKPRVDALSITADYTSAWWDWHRVLRPRFYKRVEKLVLSETIFPALVPQHLDFTREMPNLREVELPEDLGTGMDMRYPQMLPMLIYCCIFNPDGPDAPPDADMTDSVGSDFINVGMDGDFLRTRAHIEGGDAGDFSITSTFQFQFQMTECFNWPFGPTRRDVCDLELCNTIVWDRAGGIHVKDIPDLRDTWWWKEHAVTKARDRRRSNREAAVARLESYWRDVQEGLIDPEDPHNPVPRGVNPADEEHDFDWTTHLGGWDMMDMLQREEEEGTRFWPGVEAISYLSN